MVDYDDVCEEVIFVSYKFAMDAAAQRKIPYQRHFRHMRRYLAWFSFFVAVQFGFMQANAGERIWVPVRWCGVEGAPAMETPAVVNETSSDNVLWRRHERPTDQIYQGTVNMTFRAGATSVIKNGPQSFPIIEDPNPSSGIALGDLWNSGETTDSIFICRRAWMFGDPLYLDANNNGVVNQGTDSVLSTGLPTLGAIELGHDGTSLNAVPPDVRYVDANTNGNYDLGENIYRDENNNNVVDVGDTLLVNTSGTVVANIDVADDGVALVAVPDLIKYVDLIRQPANTFNIGYPAVQGITAVSANDVEFTGITFPVHGVAQPGLGGLGAVMDDPSQYLPPGPDFTLFETQLVAHEFGHAFMLPHGDGIDDDGDGDFDEGGEDPTAPVPGAGPNTLCDSNNVMSYCWLDNGSSSNPDMEFIGVGAPEAGSFTDLQATAMRDFVLANVPDRIVDPVTPPLVAARVDMLGDTPASLEWLDITDFSVSVDNSRQNFILTLATRRPFPTNLKGDVQFHFIVDTDSLSSTGSSASVLNELDIKTDFDGADYWGTVKLRRGKIQSVTLFQFSEETGKFVAIDDKLIRGVRDTIPLIVDFPFGHRATDSDDPDNRVDPILSHEIIRLVAPVEIFGLKDEITFRVEYQSERDGQVVDRARTLGLRFDTPTFPVCQTDPSIVTRGQTTKVIATGLLPDRKVHLLLGDEEIGQGSTDQNGSVVLELLIPNNARVGERLVTVGALAVSADCNVTIKDRGTEIPETPSAVIDLVFARAFTLTKGYTYNWSKDRPIIRSGTLVVLKVDPDLVFPRNSAEPVLYAGNYTVQRLNLGHESGHVIGIIPAEVDLTQTPIWFGSPELPERVSAQTIQSERTLADAAKIQPFAEKKVQNVTQEHLQASDLSSLLRDHVADLVLEYSPQEKDLAETWRLPVAKAIPNKLR